MARQAQLIAQWLLVGFIHGVMNTDNMSIAGETIDYGPCAFMDSFDPAQVYSSIDEAGRYAYGNQPRIAQWNLARLAETLLPLLEADQDAALKQAQAAIDGFGTMFEAAYTAGFLRKLGLAKAETGDLALGQQLLALMASAKADFTLTFRGLADAVAGHEASLRGQFADTTGIDGWLGQWRERLVRDGNATARDRQAMILAASPAFIPRNHRVEAALAAAVSGDFEPFETLLQVLAKPYEEQPQFAAFAEPPRPEDVVKATFCGT